MEFGQITNQTFAPQIKNGNFDEPPMMIEQYDNPLDMIHVPDFDNGQSLAGESDSQGVY